MKLTFEQRSTLPLNALDVWRRVTTPAGINDELFPWLRMTTPSALRGKTIEQVPRGQYLGRSWLLALGWLPVARRAEAAVPPSSRALRQVGRTIRRFVRNLNPGT